MSRSSILVGLSDYENFWLKFEGDVRVPWCLSLEFYCESVIKQPGIKKIFIDLMNANNIDSTTLGVLAKVSKLSQKFCNNIPTLIFNNEDIDRLITSTGLASIFNIENEINIKNISFDNLPVLNSSDEDIKKIVIEAHENLIELTQDNQLKFGTLVDSLYKS